MEITAKELQKKLKENITIIDVRTPKEFESLHLEDAINIPLDEIELDLVKKFIKENSEVFTICQSGKRGQISCDKLSQLGINATNISGGTLACKELNLPIIYGKQSISLERQVRIAAGLFVLIGSVGSNYFPNLIYLSAFVGAGLLFSGITDTCGLALVLGKMPWNKSSKSCGVCNEK